MSLLIKNLLETITEEFSKPGPEWEIAEVTDKDIEFLKDECNKYSEFDPLNKRVSLLNDLLNQKAVCISAKCKFGQVVAVLENVSQSEEIPWSLWARIFRLYSDQNAEQPFKVYFLANTNLREFPPRYEAIGPQNINGGYTYRCTRNTIVIYRAEDATRVLLHELFHSCCCDNPQNDIDTIEAETEAWAELVYVALMSHGRKYTFNDLLKRQSEWMVKQNEIVRQHMRHPSSPSAGRGLNAEHRSDNSREFPWRYTIGKEEVWRDWGVLKKDRISPPIRVKNSLRLTYPPNNILKERFSVVKRSTIL